MSKIHTCLTPDEGCTCVTCPHGEHAVSAIRAKRAYCGACYEEYEKWLDEQRKKDRAV